MSIKELEHSLSELVFDLKPASEPPVDAVPFELTAFDCSEKDNMKWIELISVYLKTAEVFEIHCWNEETEWVELALQHGTLKDDDWKHGKIVAGEVTPQFSDMLLGQSKPADTAFGHKITPFFNVFLDDKFQSCHYGTENYHR